MATSSTELQLIVSLKDEMSSNLKKLGGIIAATFAVDKLVDFGQAAVKAAMDEQAVHAKLATLLQNVAGARATDYEMLINQAEALKKLTGAQDEEIVNAQAMLATDQLTGEQIKNLIPGILDMASANAEVGQSFGDIQGAAIAVGKAFSTGAGALSRYNITMTAAEKKAFDVADKTGKLNIITKALSDNFGGAAAAAGETYQGRMNRVQNAVDDVQKSIGKALVPTIDMLSSQLLANIGTTDNTTKSQEQLSRGIYQGANFMIALSKTAYLVVQAIVGLGIVLFDVAAIAVNFNIDIVRSFFNIKDNVMVIIGALAKALKGDFQGAMGDLGRAVEKGFANTVSSLGNLVNDSKGVGMMLQDTWGSVGESMLAAVDGKGFKPMADAAGKAGAEMKKAPKEVSDAAKKAAEEIAKATDNMKKSYKSLQADGASAMADLVKSNTENLKSVRDEIAKTQKSLADLKDEYNKGFADDKKSVAEEIVKTEENIADLKKKIADEQKNLTKDQIDASQKLVDMKQKLLVLEQKQSEQTAKTSESSKMSLANEIEDLKRQISSGSQDSSNERLVDLQTKLAAEEKALKDSAAFNATISTEVAEAKRRAGLTDLQRAIEDFNSRRIEAQKEYTAKQTELQKELDAQKKKEADEIALFAFKKAEINKLLDKSKLEYDAFMNSHLKKTTDTINAEIEMYKQLAAAVAAARTGDTIAESKTAIAIAGKRASGGPVSLGETYLVGERGPELFTPRQNGSIASSDKLGGGIINITNNVTIGSKQAGQDFINQMIRQIQLAGIASQ